MKIMKQTSILFIFALTLAAIPFLSTEAQAFESIYNSSCGSCHSGASQPSCIGCHSLSNFRGQTNKTSYQRGEAMTVNVTGSGETSTSWVRVLIYDQNGNEVVRTSGSNSGMSSASTLPVALSATAPTAPGTYTWEAAWYSTDSGSMGTHGEMGRVNTNSFTVDSIPNVKVEAGQARVKHLWQRINLQNSYTDPIIRFPGSKRWILI